MTGLMETLVQTRLAGTLSGDETSYSGLDRSIIHRWSTQVDARCLTATAPHRSATQWRRRSISAPSVLQTRKQCSQPPVTVSFLLFRARGSAEPPCSARQ
ncbi:hypothetical protein [Streptomyces sp. NPDC000880]